MLRFRSRLALSLATIALAGTWSLAAPPAAPTPNVILAMADDLGWGDVGYNGSPIIKTPNLDAMSRAGLRFDRFYVPTVCSPTRGSCLTGRHPYRYGIYTANLGRLPHEERTLAEALKTRGYVTAHLGKWHLGTLTRSQADSVRGGEGGARFYSPPWDHGFDFTFSTEAKIPSWDPLWKPKGMPVSGPAWDSIEDRAKAEPYGTAYWSSDGRPVVADLDGDDSKLLMDRALRFIGEATNAQKPFFVAIWFHAPHLPVVAGPRHRALYPGTSVYERNYYGSVTALDEQMGRLRRELRTLGVADNTMLWFNSDNGPEGKAGAAPGSAGPFRGRKRDLWEGGIRVAGLLEWPAGIAQHRIVNAPCSSLDFFPTVLDLLAIPHEKPIPLDGISLRPIIDGTATVRRRPIGFEFGAMAAWLENRYKLVALLREDRPRPVGQRREPPAEAPAQASELARPGEGFVARAIDKVMLYDLLDDPGETRDLADLQPGRVQSMRAELEAWRRSCRESVAGKDY